MSTAIKTRQLEIITAAGGILSESGINGLTTKNLAAKMGFAESALYRVAKWIENREEELLAEGKLFNEAVLGAAEEYAIECALLKVFGNIL